jgi:hypothetical protein
MPERHGGKHRAEGQGGLFRRHRGQAPQPPGAHASPGSYEQFPPFPDLDATPGQGEGPYENVSGVEAAAPQAGEAERADREQQSQAGWRERIKQARDALGRVGRGGEHQAQMAAAAAGEAGPQPVSDQPESRIEHEDMVPDGPDQDAGEGQQERVGRARRVLDAVKEQKAEISAAGREGYRRGYDKADDNAKALRHQWERAKAAGRDAAKAVGDVVVIPEGTRKKWHDWEDRKQAEFDQRSADLPKHSNDLLLWANKPWVYEQVFNDDGTPRLRRADGSVDVRDAANAAGREVRSAGGQALDWFRRRPGVESEDFADVADLPDDPDDPADYPDYPGGSGPGTGDGPGTPRWGRPRRARGIVRGGFRSARSTTSPRDRTRGRFEGPGAPDESDWLSYEANEVVKDRIHAVVDHLQHAEGPFGVLLEPGTAPSDELAAINSELKERLDIMDHPVDVISGKSADKIFYASNGMIVDGRSMGRRIAYEEVRDKDGKLLFALIIGAETAFMPNNNRSTNQQRPMILSHAAEGVERSMVGKRFTVKPEMGAGTPGRHDPVEEVRHIAHAVGIDLPEERVPTGWQTLDAADPRNLNPGPADAYDPVRHKNPDGPHGDRDPTPAERLSARTDDLIALLAQVEANVKTVTNTMQRPRQSIRSLLEIDGLAESAGLIRVNGSRWSTREIFPALDARGMPLPDAQRYIRARTMLRRELQASRHPYARGLL